MSPQPEAKTQPEPQETTAEAAPVDPDSSADEEPAEPAGDRAEPEPVELTSPSRYARAGVLVGDPDDSRRPRARRAAT